LTRIDWRWRTEANQLLGEQAEQLHMAWYCVHSQGRRIEEDETDLITRVAGDIDVVLVLTQCLGEGDLEAQKFADEIERVTEDLAWPEGILTLAEERRLGGCGA
jgi:hypothetical protein